MPRAWSELAPLPASDGDWLLPYLRGFGTVGGVVGAGQTLMEIVPDDRELVVKAQVSPDDADDVYAGLTTHVRFPTLHDPTIGDIAGRISTISADSLVDPKTGAAYFTAEVRVPATELRRIAATRAGLAPIRAGIPVEILVPLTRRTVFQYLTEPIVRSFWRSGREH